MSGRGAEEFGSKSPEDSAPDQGTPAGGLQGGSADSHSSQPARVRFRELVERIRELNRNRVSDPAAQAAELGQAERSLRSFHAETLDESAVNDRNSGLLSDIREWKSFCELLELDQSVVAAESLTGEHLEQVAQGWSEAVAEVLEQPDADQCFRHLMRTTSLQLEWQGQLGEEASVPGRLEISRQKLRQALLDAIAAEEPPAQQKREWVTQLLDVSDLVMTSIDDLPPAVAAAQIDVVADDCRWHLTHVERAFGKPRRQLARKLAQVRAERQERELQYRLEKRFGRKLVGATERLVLVLIFVVIGLMLTEFVLELSPRTIFWFNIIDAAACGVFLTEFFTKLSFVSNRPRWFWRHFIIDFIPSIPFALVTSGLATSNPADAVRLGRLGRLLRLPRLVRYVRILRPVIRVFRGFALLVRGLDRLARRYGHLLNQNVILYPTRAELERYRAESPLKRASLGRLYAELDLCWKDLVHDAPQEQHESLAKYRLELLRDELVELSKQPIHHATVSGAQAREVPAGALIDELSSVNAHDLEDRLAAPLISHMARIVRLYSRPPLSWMPIISRCVPEVSPQMTDSEVVSSASRRLAAVLKRYHDMWFWVADLYGTVTPSQFVDRVGTTLVNSSFRPAYRLALFGGVLLFTQLLIYAMALTVLEPVEKFLARFVGTPVLVLGGICVLILAVGLWLKSLAREATEFYERSAQAQYLSLMETVRSRYLDRDTQMIFDRVLRPELELLETPAEVRMDEQLRMFQGRARASLLDEYADRERAVGVEGFETTALLYRDWLDGALLTESDTRTTSQLLGNPSVRQFLSLSERFSAKEIKSLQKLDLVRQKSLFGGPYIWFNFISRSIAHSVARLLVSYNQHAFTLDELPHLRPDQLRAYQKWLGYSDTGEEASDEKIEQAAEKNYVTTVFSSMHFLDVHPQRDQEVEAMFGPDLLTKLHRDRSLLARRIFGTYPMHNRPKEQRVVNLYAIYSSWLAGGRALLLPLFLMMAGFRFLGGLLSWITRSVQEIRNPDSRQPSTDAANAHFFTAVRKIQRIRGPVVSASIRLRCRMDPEYLGVSLPGHDDHDLLGADLEADLSFLNADFELISDTQRERLRAQADMKRLDELIAGGLLKRAAEANGLGADAFCSQKHLRATALIYLADLRGVRRGLSAPQILDDAYRMASELSPMPRRLWPRLGLKRRFKKYWAEHGWEEAGAERLAWRATVNNFWGAADALRTWSDVESDPVERAESTLQELLLHPSRITQQLAAVRTIQTLAVLDVLHYREHVFQLGRYADMGDSPGSLLQWKTLAGEQLSTDARSVS